MRQGRLSQAQCLLTETTSPKLISEMSLFVEMKKRWGLWEQIWQLNPIFAI